MKNSILIFAFLLISTIGFSQETEPKFDEKLAKSLNADEYGMKKYVFCLLKSGTNTTTSKEETQKLFEGHMANINKLAKEGKLVVAGSFIKNAKIIEEFIFLMLKPLKKQRHLFAVNIKNT